MSSFESNVGSQYKLVPTNLSGLPLTENPAELELTNELLPLLAIALGGAELKFITSFAKWVAYGTTRHARYERTNEEPVRFHSGVNQVLPARP